jgi:hypothetical protein
MRRLLFALFSATTLLPSSGCSKDPGEPPAPPANVSATINGTPTTFNAIITVDTLSTPGTVYIVAHSDSANLTPLLEITLSNTPLRPGVYPFADTTGGDIALLGYTLWLNGGAVQYPSVSDTVTLTAAYRDWISGTFQGTCEYSADSVVSVTNGQFAVSYPRH